MRDPHAPRPMTKPGSHWSGCRLAIVLGAVSAVLIFGHSSSATAQDIFQRTWTSLILRVTGPLSFRFLLQPAMAAIVAIRDGIRDARTGRSPYFWTVLTNHAERAGRLREGLKATARIIVLALVMDAAYQIMVLKAFYIGEATAIAIALAFVPYLLLRGPVARVARWWQQ